MITNHTTVGALSYVLRLTKATIEGAPNDNQHSLSLGISLQQKARKKQEVWKF